ncbi:MAG: nucleotide exchange factor GrpE [Methanomicrobiales archaeon]|jgi:molecular chaperone GrpE|nr:nucleotide exchange factor GrpE [Methanomicrobiales archaeon]
MEQTSEEKYQSTGEPQGLDTDIEETEGQEMQDPSFEAELDDPLALCQNQYSELLEKHLRLAADLENIRRRSYQEIERQVTSAVTAFARDLLEVSDNFERATSAQEDQIPEGILQIKRQLENALEKQGITAFSSQKEQFDPTLHEAIAYIPSSEPEGTVIDEINRGYIRNDRVIRCAKVTVSKGNEDSQWIT